MLFSIFRSVAGFVLFMGLMLVFALAAGIAAAVVGGLTLLVQGQVDVAILAGLVALVLFGAMRFALGVITYGTDRLYG